ncbi:MAG: alpha-1,2-fucosyltransferase [Rikenellaceae bacterium]
MMILYTQCGLGNQMFQYAYVKYLESKGCKKIWIDASAPSMNKHTGFELRRLFPNIEARGRFLPYLAGRTLHLVSDVFKKGFGYTLETETSGKLWLRGYWQECCFADSVREKLLEDYRFIDIDDPVNRSLLEHIEKSNSVSIHIRRGDYIAPNDRAFFGDVCNIAYYTNAIRYIREHIVDPQFFVFSNDIDWVRDHFELTGAVYVNNNSGANSFRDMQLMSRCRHNIIANSSFSWWGAWLNTNPDRIVLAPPKWFNNSAPDLVNKIEPESWIRIGEAYANVSLIIDFEISEDDRSAIMEQSYRDLELVETEMQAKGNHIFYLTKEEIPLFRNRSYLNDKLFAYFKNLF